MQSIVALLSVFLLSACSGAETVKDYLSIPGPIRYMDTAFELKWSDHPTDTYYLQEYLPENESPDQFNQMFTVHLFETDMEINEFVDLKVQELEQRKLTDSQVMHKVTSRPDGGEIMLEFFVGQGSEDALEILEFNLYNYSPAELGSDRKGFVIYAYTKRAYGENIPAFSQAFNGERSNYFYSMISLVKPEVKLK